jgi:formate/nitrite transporter FocA (FNT family)
MLSKIDPPWEWSWQRRAMIVFIILAALWTVAVWANDLQKQSNSYKTLNLGHDTHSSALFALAIAIGCSLIVRLLLWVLPEKRPTDTYRLEAAMIVVIAALGLAGFVAHKAADPCKFPSTGSISDEQMQRCVKSDPNAWKVEPAPK